MSQYNSSSKALQFRDNAAFVLIRAKEQQTHLFIVLGATDMGLFGGLAEPTSLPLGATDMGLFTVGGLADRQLVGC